ncbi:hypothetical protein D0859_01986 [Hortaea werneckii]|uniref:CHY-type domain-containing protein n=1 Tax=Hortaea werneckii TaxID=91943 RepID=A0A3M7J8M3_HORWE|nr:hypothetical protein D0859_01986 [Hortaea werneckii]
MPEGEQASTATLPSRPAKQRQCSNFSFKGYCYSLQTTLGCPMVLRMCIAVCNQLTVDLIGCRAGANCAFSHPLDQDTPSHNPAGPVKNESKDTYTRAKNTPQPARPAAVRPVPKAEVEDPRAFQIGQIQRRFKPHSAETDDGTTLSLRMKPSDPDFPYEIDDLECELKVPRSYPNSGRPSIQVTNKDIPRGFQINIERGFDLILSSNPGITLLAAMNRLDRQLEPILAGRMAETIKIVANKGPTSSAPVQLQSQPPPPRAAPNNSTERQIVHSKQPVVFTPQQRDEARSKRHDSNEAGNVEAAFTRLPGNIPGATLTQLVNHLVLHISAMAAESSSPSEEDVSGTPAEKGILLSFPNLELHGIELLEVSSLSITIKCERCKDTMDVHRLRNYSGNASAMRQETCKKCAITMAVGFRSDMIHANSVRAGYLDLDGCTVVDMLPSNFLPTCAECSTQFPAPGIVAVRGDSAMAICRECHKKMTLRISELKFLLVSATAARASRALGRKKPKENLGIHAGSELPRKGRCSHYAKSFRWFRFSCCSKVFPCDRCHDQQSDHPLEHANRMIWYVSPLPYPSSYHLGAFQTAVLAAMHAEPSLSLIWLAWDQMLTL